MIKKWFFLIILLHSFSFAESKLEIKNGKYYAKGELYTGIKVEENSFLRTETPIVNGLVHGTVISYYKSKGVDKIQLYSNGKRNGPYLDYYLNGILEISCFYKNGLKEGKQLEYSQSGKLRLLSEYSNGKQNGEVIEFFPNGSIKRQWTCKNDERNGLYIEKDKNGNILEKLFFKNGDDITDTLKGKSDPFSQTGPKIPIENDLPKDDFGSKKSP